MFRLFFIFLAIAALILPAFNAFGAEKKRELEADSVVYNRVCDTFIANGNTKIFLEDRIITAPRIIYIKESNKIFGPQGAILHDNNENVFSLKKLELNYKTEEAYGLTLQAKMAKGVKIAATSTHMENKNKMTAYQVVFSPCKICQSNFVPGIPLWQIRASEVRINTEEEVMTFKKAKLEIFGKPVLYLPYATIPTPNASRKTGFLVPTFRTSTEFGFQAKIPFYYNISPNMDFTFKPTFNTKKNALYELELRKILKSGKYSIAGSFTKEDKLDLKSNNKNGKSYIGHINASGDMEGTINDKIANYGFKFNRILGGSKTYLKRHDIDESDILGSKLYLRHQNEDLYLSAEALNFQDLRPNSHSAAPIIPFLRYYKNIPIKAIKDAKLKISTEAFMIDRNEGNSYSKAIAKGEFNYPYINKLGHVFDFSAGARIDACSMLSHTSDKQKKGNYGRFLPYAEAAWKFPFSGKLFEKKLIIQPMASVFFSPYQKNSDYEVFEESSDIEFNYSNLFKKNRFWGLEQIESGTKINYGVKSLLKNDGGKLFEKLGLFIGGSRNFQNMKNPSSDYKNVNSKTNHIAQIFAQITQNSYVIDKLWFNQNDFSIKKHEIDAIVHLDKLSLEASYMFQKNITDESYPQEISLNLEYNIHKEWWANFNIRSGLGSMDNKKDKNNRKLISDGVGILYKGGCLHVNFAINRNHTELNDLKPSVSYTLKISAPIFG